MSRLRTICVTLLAATGLVLGTGAAVSASTNVFSFGSNLGTLTYTATSYAYSCSSQYGIVHYTEWVYGGFIYDNPAASIDQVISGETYYDYGIGGRYVGSGDCPAYPRGDRVIYQNTTNGSGYTISIPPGCCGTLTASIAVPGYVNPKYVVLGVTYAPPGPQSNVNYANTALFSNTSSVSSSFTTSYTQTVSITNSFMKAWKNGGVDASTTVSNGYTQETGTSSSSSITVSKQSGTSLQVPGPTCPYTGVDHDYDIIWVWLNPVHLFTLTNNGFVQWNGYGVSSEDPVTWDVEPVYAGCLNGDPELTSYCNNQFGAAFQRTWATNAGQSFPSGQGPGLTATDLQNILATDPYGGCKYNSAIGASVCPSPDPTRFTQTTTNFGNQLNYQQPAPGANPFTKSYTAQYSNTSTQGQGASYTGSQTFGWESTFGASLFGFGFKQTLTTSQTLKWTNQWNNQFTSTTTSTSAVNVTGPACTVIGGICDPTYPPTNAFDPVACSALSSPQAYGQADLFNIYQDNLFGSFLLVPVSYQ